MSSSCQQPLCGHYPAKIFLSIIFVLSGVFAERAAAAALTLHDPDAADNDSIHITWDATGSLYNFAHWNIYYAKAYKVSEDVYEYEQPFAEDYGYYLDQETGLVRTEEWNGPWQRPDWNITGSDESTDREITIPGLESNQMYNINIGYENNPLFESYIYNSNNDLIAGEYNLGYDNLQDNHIDPNQNGELDFWFPIYKYFDNLPPDPPYQDLNPYYGNDVYKLVVTAPLPPTVTYFDFDTSNYNSATITWEPIDQYVAGYFKTFKTWFYLPNLPENQTLVYWDSNNILQFDSFDNWSNPSGDYIQVGEDDKYETHTLPPDLYHDPYSIYTLSQGRGSVFPNLRHYFGTNSQFELDGLTFAAQVWAINNLDPLGLNDDTHISDVDSISISGPHYLTVPLNSPSLDIIKDSIDDNLHYFHLNWWDNSYNETGYYIQKSYDGEEFFTIGTVLNGVNGDYNTTATYPNNKEFISYDLVIDYDTFVQCAYRVEAFNACTYSGSNSVVLNYNHAARVDPDDPLGDIMIFPFPAPNVNKANIEFHNDVAPNYPVYALIPVDISNYSTEQLAETDMIITFRRGPNEDWVQISPDETTNDNNTLYVVMDDGTTTGEYTPLIPNTTYEYAIYTSNDAGNWSLYWNDTVTVVLDP